MITLLHTLIMGVIDGRAHMGHHQPPSNKWALWSIPIIGCLMFIQEIHP